MPHCIYHIKNGNVVAVENGYQTEKVSIRFEAIKRRLEALAQKDKNLQGSVDIEMDGDKILPNAILNFPEKAQEQLVRQTLGL